MSEKKMNPLCLAQCGHVQEALQDVERTSQHTSAEIVAVMAAGLAGKLFGARQQTKGCTGPMPLKQRINGAPVVYCPTVQKRFACINNEWSQVK